MNEDQICTRSALNTGYRNIEVIIRSLERNIAGCPLSQKEAYYKALTSLLDANFKMRSIEDYLIKHYDRRKS